MITVSIAFSVKVNLHGMTWSATSAGDVKSNMRFGFNIDERKSAGCAHCPFAWTSARPIAFYPSAAEPAMRFWEICSPYVVQIGLQYDCVLDSCRPNNSFPSRIRECASEKGHWDMTWPFGTAIGLNSLEMWIVIMYSPRWPNRLIHHNLSPVCIPGSGRGSRAIRREHSYCMSLARRCIALPVCCWKLQPFVTRLWLTLFWNPERAKCNPPCSFNHGVGIALYFRTSS